MNSKFLYLISFICINAYAERDVKSHENIGVISPARGGGYTVSVSDNEGKAHTGATMTAFSRGEINLYFFRIPTSVGDVYTFNVDGCGSMTFVRARGAKYAFLQSDDKFLAYQETSCPPLISSTDTWLIK
ncbi:hypothetical protein [Pseudomonas sp. rhizo25]|uniref:hypothetical protein n=1 Tax=Pseudomonas sp. rhizo25 TaxID=3059675 RepID=UPI0028918C40|nr:hypothetical protein [Pseudomonas sp. rhizo25]MDT3233178.1 hypothetical protein [Pseudomonas sp. rhizo25]